MTRSPAKTDSLATRTDQQEAAFIADALNAEAEAVRRIADQAISTDAPDWRRALDLLATCTGHVVVSGMGKSGLVGAKISATFTSLGQPSSVLHPSEAVHGDLGRVRRGDVVILLSYSGETEEVVDLAVILRADGVPCLGISESGGTTLAKHCNVHLSIGVIREACPHNLAPTASTTAQLAIGDTLALALARRRNFDADDFHRSHPGGMLGVGLRKITEVLRFRVGENLPVADDRLTVRAALQHADRMPGQKRRAGAIILIGREGQLTGIFTDGDLRRLVADDLAFMDEPIATFMSVQPKRLLSDDLVRDAVRLAREYRIDEIPVVDGAGRPVGLVDVQDLIALKVVQE